jgi:hypothetical protein
LIDEAVRRHSRRSAPDGATPSLQRRASCDTRCRRGFSSLIGEPRLPKPSILRRVKCHAGTRSRCLWVIRGHSNPSARSPLIPQKRASKKRFAAQQAKFTQCARLTYRSAARRPAFHAFRLSKRQLNSALEPDNLGQDNKDECRPRHRDDRIAIRLA